MSVVYSPVSVPSTPSPTSDNNTSAQEEGFPIFVRYIIGILLFMIIVVTLIGNALVVLSVINFRRLRSVTNCFVVSLATADITVAILVMPSAIVYELLGIWKFGWIFCYFWISCDVMCCTASILHLCVISLDRYWAITDPYKYKQRTSKCRTAIMITSVWLCSALISFIPIYLGWFADDPDSIYQDTPVCGLNVNQVYAVISSMTSFYIPLLVMVFAYWRIFRIARKQALEIEKMERSLRNHFSYNDENFNRKSKNVSKDSKAIRTLGTIMGIFIISWLPFFLMYIIIPFCSECWLPKIVVSFLTWLGYANSFINPCVYAYLNKDFNMAFRKLLSCARFRTNRNPSKNVVIKYERTGINDADGSSSSSKQRRHSDAADVVDILLTKPLPTEGSGLRAGNAK
ncbi:putative G-protein coupled receptor No18 [Tubulanus polymorphus]|uniref:putative G-protein coupled receptor No18 n=1 Tax=Tubulanus polymorphus TaxID=672921 RepID=UPI003DA4FA65